MVRAHSTTRDDRGAQKKIQERQLDRLQKAVRVRFKNRSLLRRALTHRSYVNESGRDVPDNERLEYLGDSVLALVVNEYLFKHFEEYPEGKLAKIKASVVSEATLAKLAVEMHLGEYIFMGRGEEQSGGRERTSILANTLEALIGAIYLDAGLKATKNFVLGIIKDEIEATDVYSYLRDPKTTLQEYVQKKYKDRPVYQVVEERGPDHRKEFTVRLVINGKDIVTGEGPSKRKAEMGAARAALKKIEEGEIDI